MTGRLLLYSHENPSIEISSNVTVDCFFVQQLDLRTQDTIFGKFRQLIDGKEGYIEDVEAFL